MWLWVRISLLPYKLQIWHLLQAMSCLAFKWTIEFGFTLKLDCEMIITYSQMQRIDKDSQHSSIIWPVWPNGLVFVYVLRVGISLLSLKLQKWHLVQARTSLTFRKTIECRWTLKLALKMIITCSKMQGTDKYSQHSSIIWPAWLSGCGLESRCCHLNCIYRPCFEQGVPWHSSKL